MDILVNHGSITGIRELVELSDEAFESSMAANLKAAFLCMQAVLPGMRQRQRGLIVNISPTGMRISTLTASDNAAASPANDRVAGNLGGDLAERVPLARLGTAQAVVMALGNIYFPGQIVYAFGASFDPGTPAALTQDIEQFF